MFSRAACRVMLPKWPTSSTFAHSLTSSQLRSRETRPSIGYCRTENGVSASIFINGTLLGGPLLLNHRICGLESAEPKLLALRQLIALSRYGELPVGLHPKEVRAPRWVLELRTADGIAAGATQHEMAKSFFGQAVALDRWRLESASYRLRIQRLARAARRNLSAPLGGPWFD